MKKVIEISKPNIEKEAIELVVKVLKSGFLPQGILVEKFEEEIELIKLPQQIPEVLPFGLNQVVPMAAGETIQWSIHDLT